MKTLLKSLGFSSYEADKLIKEFGEMPLRLLSSERGRKTLAEEVDSASVNAAYVEFCRIHSAKNLFSFLEPQGFSKNTIYELLRLNDENEEKALDSVRTDPFGTVFSVDAPFKAAESLAKKVGFNGSERKAEAAVYSALCMAEKGVEEPDDSKIGKYLEDKAGSLCLPLSEAIEAAEILLKSKTISSEMVVEAAHRLHRRKMMLLTKKKGADGKTVMYAYRARSAEVEFYSAERLKERIELAKNRPIHYEGSPFKEIDNAQARLGVSLSYEQSDAVYNALTNRISVITGGPGTGKTATQKVLLEAYKRLSRNKPVLLMAPTGQAAKRMSQATGYPASTIHSALGISPGESDLKAGRDLKPGLIILDETSMVDAPLFCMLLRHVSRDTILVIVGDINQLPSIGAGAVLRELIECVPTARLTKVFRQGDGSDIAINAARINIGTAKMIEGEKFSFIEASTSEEIQKKVCEEYARQVDLVGADNVVVLTPFRKSTPTGVNALNAALRKALNKDKSRYVKHENMKVYEGDKIIFLRNKFGLVNGEVGVAEKIVGDKVKCRFREKSILLSGTELSMIIPAYSQTVHKSQGAEYPVVILVADTAHSRLNSKKLVYTAVTRSKEKLICIGQKKAAFEAAVMNPTAERYSNLATIVNS